MCRSEQYRPLKIGEKQKMLIKEENEADYRFSHQTAGKGKSYDKSFKKYPYRAFIWKYEQTILDRIIKQHYYNREINYLDFACGTGRILAYLEDRASTAIGIDISTSMLDVAKRNVKRATLIQADITRDDILANCKYNLITAFRFFPNAQNSLRSEAITTLANSLSNDGYIIFNSHKSPLSLLNRLRRFLRRASYERGGMTFHEAQGLAKKAGLKIVKVYHGGLLPIAENRFILLTPFLRFIESIASACPFCKDLSQYLIFVCKKSDSFTEIEKTL